MNPNRSGFDSWGNWISLWWWMMDYHPFCITLERHLDLIDGDQKP